MASPLPFVDRVDIRESPSWFWLVGWRGDIDKLGSVPEVEPFSTECDLKTLRIRSVVNAGHHRTCIENGCCQCTKMHLVDPLKVYVIILLILALTRLNFHQYFVFHVCFIQLVLAIWLVRKENKIVLFFLSLTFFNFADYSLWPETWHVATSHSMICKICTGIEGGPHRHWYRTKRLDPA